MEGAIKYGGFSIKPVFAGYDICHWHGGFVEHANSLDDAKSQIDDAKRQMDRQG